MGQEVTMYGGRGLRLVTWEDGCLRTAEGCCMCCVGCSEGRSGVGREGGREGREGGLLLGFDLCHLDL